MMSASKGRLAPDHLRELQGVQAREGSPREDRDAEAPERHGRRVREERERRCVERLETQARHQGGRDGDRGPEAGRRLEERPEDEGYKDDLDAPVVADAGQGVADGVEEARVDDDVVYKDGVYDDPDDGEEAEADTKQR